MAWYENHKWKSNPFVIDPIPTTFIVMGIRSKAMESATFILSTANTLR